MNMNARIKLSAREALLGSSLAVLPTLALLIILTVAFSLCSASAVLLPVENPKLIQTITAALALPASLLIVAPLRMKLQIKHISLALGSREERELHFHDRLNACLLYSMLFGLKLLWFAAFEAVPAVMLSAFMLRISQQAVSLRASRALLIGIAVLAVTGAVFWAVTVQRYAKAEFYFAAYSDVSPSRAVSLSVKHCRDTAADIFMFKLSFLPWLLLCAAVLPALYIIPYYKQSITCRFLCGR